MGVGEVKGMLTTDSSSIGALSNYNRWTKLLSTATIFTTPNTKAWHSIELVINSHPSDKLTIYIYKTW